MFTTSSTQIPQAAQQGPRSSPYGQNEPEDWPWWGIFSLAVCVVALPSVIAIFVYIGYLNRKLKLVTRDVGQWENASEPREQMAEIESYSPHLDCSDKDANSSLKTVYSVSSLQDRYKKTCLPKSIKSVEVETPAKSSDQMQPCPMVKNATPNPAMQAATQPTKSKVSKSDSDSTMKGVPKVPGDDPTEQLKGWSVQSVKPQVQKMQMVVKSQVRKMPMDVCSPLKTVQQQPAQGDSMKQSNASTPASNADAKSALPPGSVCSSMKDSKLVKAKIVKSVSPPGQVSRSYSRDSITSQPGP